MRGEVHKGEDRPGLFLKISPTNFDKASRDKRELGVVKDLGMKTVVLTRGERLGRSTIDGWECVEVSTRPFGRVRGLNRLNRLCSLFIWAYHARRLRPSIISGHDLVGTLIAWLSTLLLLERHKPAIVYDSHEFELGRNTGRTRSVATTATVRYLESFLIRRCTFSIMVNGAIADRVQEVHSLEKRPIVVRSTPPIVPVDEEKTAQRHDEFCRLLGVPSTTFLLMYHGAVIPNRGIEASIEALVDRNFAALVVLGDGSDDYVARLRRFATERGVDQHVLFHPAVPLAELPELVGAADAGMIVVPPVSESYVLMLPNKLFENVQSLTPVIASDFPEIGRVVRRYDIGLLVDPEDSAQVGGAVDQLYANLEDRKRLRQNLEAAKMELCWENERLVLASAYRNVMG